MWVGASRQRATKVNTEKKTLVILCMTYRAKAVSQKKVVKKKSNSLALLHRRGFEERWYGVCSVGNRRIAHRHRTLVQEDRKKKFNAIFRLLGI